ncbi:hypothetical protein Msil_1030 [Methylocella silvestris BL2]|uniref:Uncharacterized protein n=1 Tax=Methylocella silvestris (strain DSM 15510 / CIP 108128 / LMG 27833 / NCIMB 13906 / BL2) TaxID=395965 RepID=B8ELK5_METSB|nr:hypothetical protein [Methylocella silvestris]ACK49999.1 hypothetical protein Msil_1030 [Methylocella silvestris BL2]
MTKILILVCSMSTPVEDCSPMNAISASRGPSVQSAISCGLFGQSQLAQSAIGPVADEYEKIVCSTGGAS